MTPAKESNKNGRLVVFLSACSLFAVLATSPFQIAASRALSTNASPSYVLIIVSLLISLFLPAAISALIGVPLSRKVKLDMPILQAWINKHKDVTISWKWFCIACSGGMFGGTAVLLLTNYVTFSLLFSGNNLPPIRLAPWLGLLTIFQGGIVEEIICRLFVMTFLVWLLSIGYRKRFQVIPSRIYWIAIMVAAILFSLIHYPQGLALGMTPAQALFYVLMGNGIMGGFFGYLYWKKGLEYAILAHASADLALHFFLPLAG